MPGRLCSFPNCPNKISPVTLRSLSFHRVPTADEELMKRWLLALQMDPATPADVVKREDHKICSVHFEPGDFYPRKAQPAPAKKRRKGLRRSKPLKEHLERTKLKPHAVPKSCLPSGPEVMSTSLLTRPSVVLGSLWAPGGLAATALRLVLCSNSARQSNAARAGLWGIKCFLRTRVEVQPAFDSVCSRQRGTGVFVVVGPGQDAALLSPFHT